jgi:hypothetical protein
MLLICPIIAVALSTSQNSAAAGQPDVAASFSFSPLLPVTGETVTFTSSSTSSSATNSIETQEWDFDDDGSFDDRVGTIVRRAFAVAGSYRISLRVVGKHKGTDVTTQIVTVQPRSSQLLKPFPVVRLVGKITRNGVRVRRLTVNAPKEASVVVTCNGHRCPRRRRTRSSRRAAPEDRMARAARLVQISRLEGSLLRFGSKLRVYVTKPPLIGKYTRFKIRRSGPPERIDRCLIPGREKPARCPA